MNWLVGFVLGAAGGWALGSLARPVGLGAGPTRLRRWLRAGERDDRPGGALAGSRPSRRRPDGLLLDERLTRAARDRVAAEGIDDLRVDITTVDGVMYLRGRPRNARAAAVIVQIAETTPGVARVVNELKPPDEPREEGGAA